MDEPSATPPDAADDVAFAGEHFSPLDPRLVGDGPLLGDGQARVIDFMLERCPVTHTDAQFIGSPHGSWIVNRYEDVRSVLRQPDVFSSKAERGERKERELIPFEVDPPLLLDYRRLLQPFFTINAARQFEPTARRLVGKHLEGFAGTGRCEDLIGAFARPFASEAQWRWLVGLDELDHEQLLDWMMIWLHKHFEPEFAEAEGAWVDWIKRTVEERRQAPRRDDLIDTLLHVPMRDRLLSEDEVIGVILLMIIGGVPAVTDAIGNLVLRLAVDPDLQDELRGDPSLIPLAVEESLRLEPPSSGSFRRCTRDTELGGRHLKAGDQIFWYMSAANRDPAVFEAPHTFDLQRKPNPHLAFGTGYHRCLGASFARQNICIAIEEILTRMHDIALVPDDPPDRVAAIAWGVHRLPLQFTPSESAGSAR